MHQTPFTSQVRDKTPHNPLARTGIVAYGAGALVGAIPRLVALYDASRAPGRSAVHTPTTVPTNPRTSPSSTPRLAAERNDGQGVHVYVMD